MSAVEARWQKPMAKVRSKATAYTTANSRTMERCKAAEKRRMRARVGAIERSTNIAMSLSSVRPTTRDLVRAQGDLYDRDKF